MPVKNNPITLPVVAIAAVPKKRFVSAATTVTVLGQKAIGVNSFTAAQGDCMMLDTAGLTQVEAGTAIASGTEVMSDAAGRAIAFVDNGTNSKLGIVAPMPGNFAIAAGQYISVVLSGRSGTGVHGFIDSFSTSTLNADWRWINQQSFSLTAVPGQLRLPRSEGHGFYRTVATENEATPVQVLYHKDRWTIANGFEVIFNAGFYNLTSFGQVGLVVFSDDPAASTPSVTSIDNYTKFVIEFTLDGTPGVDNVAIVLLKEINGVDPRDAANLKSVAIGGQITAQFRLRYVDGNWVSQYRSIGSNIWIDHFTTSCNFLIGAPVRVGFFCESDHLIGSGLGGGNGQFGFIDEISIADGLTTPAIAPIYDYTDGFNLLSLDAGWLKENNTAGAWALTGSRIQTIRYSGDIFQGNNSPVPTLYRSGIKFTDGFECVVDAGYVETNLTTGQGGILIYSDFDNYFRFFIEFANGSNNIVGLKEVAQAAQLGGADINVVAYIGTSVTLRVQVIGSALKTQYKPIGGAVWIDHFSTTLPAIGSTLKVGLYSLDFQDSSLKNMYFDDFKLRSGL